MKYKRPSDGFIMTHEQAQRFWNYQYYYVTAEDSGLAIWQAAFDNVLAGVDDELVAGVWRACYGDAFAHPAMTDYYQLLTPQASCLDN